MISAEERKAVCDKADQESYSCKSVPSPQQPPKFFSDLLQHSPEVASAALGSLGSNLIKFAEAADLYHPDLPGIANGKLCDTEFSGAMSELLGQASYALDHNHTRVLPHLSKIASRLEDYGLVSLMITDPHKNASSLVRFIKDPGLREEMRLRRKGQEMSLCSFYRKRQDTWALPSSFKGWTRNTVPYGEDADLLERRVPHYERLGLTDQADSARERLSALRDKVKEQYYGFNRCPLSTAAIILAKTNDFEMLPSTVSRYTESPLRIKMGAKAVSRVKKADLVQCVLATGGDEYQPWVYVAQSFSSIPDRMSKLMRHLDAFPEAGGKPIFDHFCVLMPSLHSDRLSVVPGKVNAHKRWEMDVELLNHGVFTAILLGECDGKQYFLDYWC